MAKMTTTKQVGVRPTHRGTAWQVFAKRDGRIISKTMPLTSTADELRKAREELIGRHHLARVAPAPSRAKEETFHPAAKRYLNKPMVKEMPSYDDRAYDILCWCEALGDIPMSSITPELIIDILDQWMVSGRKGGGGLSGRSVDLRRTALSKMFTDLGYRKRDNPVIDVPRYDMHGKHCHIVLDPFTAYRLIARVGRTGTRIRRKEFRGKRREPSLTRLRLRVLLTTGIPHEQLMTLERHHVDWDEENPTMKVAARRKGKAPKSEVAPRKVLPVLPGLPQYQRPGKPANCALRALKKFFDGGANGRFSQSSMNAAWQRALVAENAHRAKHGHPPIPNCSPKALKHTFLTRYAEFFKDNRVAQELGLHARMTTTERYISDSLSPRMAAAVASLRAAIVNQKLQPEVATRPKEKKTA